MNKEDNTEQKQKKKKLVWILQVELCLLVQLVQFYILFYMLFERWCLNNDWTTSAESFNILYVSLNMKNIIRT